MKRIAAVFGCALMLLTPLHAFASQPEAPPPSSPVAGRTWQYLQSHPPGEWSIAAFSLGGKEPPNDARSALNSLLETGIGSGFATPSDLARGIILLLKQESNPLDYKNTNLLSKLYTYDNLYADGLDSAVLALLAYQSAQSALDSAAAIPETARNSVPSVLDYLVSSQQRSGGFSSTAGRDPDVITTARVLTALGDHGDRAYVGAAVDKALQWLSAQQNADGSFSSKNMPSCEATATVVLALRICGVSIGDARFVKENGGLLEALERFEQTDGGYAPFEGQPSDPSVTELVILALYADQTEISPFLPPSAYPGYVAPQENPKTVALNFIFGLLGMLAIIYFLLILTTKIGKKWGRFPDPPQKDSEYSGETPDKPVTSQRDDTRTMEINIPMNAKLPDFSKIHERESSLGQDDEKPAGQ